MSIDREKLDKHTDRLQASLIELNRSKFNYLNTLTIASSTIASFSLLALKPSDYLIVNIKLLLWAFLILIFNSFFAIFITLLTILILNKSSSLQAKSVKSLILEHNNLTSTEEKTYSKEEIHETHNKEWDPLELWANILEWASLLVPAFLLVGVVLIFLSLKDNLL